MDVSEELKAKARELLVSLSDDREPDSQSDVEKIVAALLAERERCAKIADGWAHRDTGYEIAAAIRS